MALVILFMFVSNNNERHLGIGWGCQYMVYYQFWFCSVNKTTFVEKYLTYECGNQRFNSKSNDLMSCCITDVTIHGKTACVLKGDISYCSVRATSTCLLSTSTFITAEASICPSSEDNDHTKDDISLKCFNLHDIAEDDAIEFITACDSIDCNRPRGTSNRTSIIISLSTGSFASSSSSDSNIFRFHSSFMLLA